MTNLTANITTLEYDELEQMPYTVYILNRETAKILSAVVDSDCDRAFERITLLALELGIELESEDFSIDDNLESISDLIRSDDEYLEYISAISGLKF